MSYSPRSFGIQHRFRGLNLYTEAADIAVDELTAATNLLNGGGAMVTRPGLQAQVLSSAAVPSSGQPRYGPWEFLRSDGTIALLSVNNGKLYFTTAGTLPLTDTEILLNGTTSFHLNSSQVQITVEGKYAYVVEGSRNITDLVIDGSSALKVTSSLTPFAVGDAGKTLIVSSGTGFTKQTTTLASVTGSTATLALPAGTLSSTGGVAELRGQMYRINILADNTYTATAVSSLTPPGAPAPIALTNTVIDLWSSVAGWTADYLAPSGSAKTITAATGNAVSPIRVTSTAHGYSNNDLVYIDTVVGNTAANGAWLVSNKDSDHFDLLYTDNSTASVGNGAYVSGGTIVKLGAGVNIFPQQGLFTSWGNGGGNWNSSGGGWNNDPNDGTLDLGYTAGFPAPDGSGNIQGVQLDDRGDGFSTLYPIPNLPLANDTTRYATHAYIQVWWNSDNLNHSLDVTVSAFSDAAGTVPMSVRTINIPSGNANASTIQTLAGIVDFSDVAATNILSWKVRFQAGLKNQTGSVRPYLAKAVFYPIVGSGNSTSTTSATFNATASQVSLDARAAAGTGIPVPHLKEIIGGLHARKDLLTTGAAAKTISGVSAATPMRVTATGHGYLDGQAVSQVGILGALSANGVFYIKKNDANTYDLYSDSGLTAGVASTGTYVSGGTATAVTPYDFSTTQLVTALWTVVGGYTTTDLLFRIGLRNSAGITYSNQAVLSTDNTYYSADISFMSQAQRQHIYSVEIVFGADLAVTSTTGPAFAFGPLAASGNLSVSNLNTISEDYVWVETEAQDFSVSIAGVATGDTTDGVLESDPGAVSALLTTTPLNAKAQMTLPALVNATTTHRYVYRLGGTIGAADNIPTYRLVAKLPVWSDTIDPSSPCVIHNSDGSLSYTATWNHTTGVFVDNTPDSTFFNLQNVTVMESGRGAPPPGATCVTLWRNHIVLARDSTIYVSWLLNTDAAAGLYYNNLNDPRDPSGAIKGWQVPVTPNDGDKIKQIVSLGQYLVILKGKSIHVMTGSNPFDFVLTEHLKDSGIGLVAPNGTAKAHSSLALLGNNAVWDYTGGDSAEKASLNIEAPAYPVPGVSYLVTSANGAIVFHSQRLYLFAPATSGGANSVCWVFDMRTAPNGQKVGWTKFTGMAVTGACSLSGIANADDMYLAGLDGQLYRLTGSGDLTTLKAITNVTGTTTVTVTSNGHGYSNGDTVLISGVGGITGVNGTWVVASAATNTFVITGAVGAGSYTSSTGCVGKLAAVAQSFKTRGLMQSDDNLSWFATNRPTRAYASLYTSEATTVTCTVSCVGNANTSAIAHTTPAATNTLNGIRDKVNGNVRGSAAEIALDLSTIYQAKIVGAAVEGAEGSLRGTI